MKMPQFVGKRISTNSPFLFFIFSLFSFAIFNLPTASAALTDGLIANYAMDEGSGSTITDSSGNGLNGSISGATRTVGKIGTGALSFDGTNDYASIPDNNLLDPTGDMTLSAWVKFNALKNQKILYKGHNASPWESYELYTSETSKPGVYQIIFQRADSLSQYQSVGYNTGGVGIQTGVWYHIIGVKEGASMKTYINGSDGSDWTFGNASNPSLNSNMVLAIGSSSWYGDNFNGLLDEIRLYNRALSAQEAADLYNLGSAASSSSQSSSQQSSAPNFPPPTAFGAETTCSNNSVELYWQAPITDPVSNYKLDHYEIQNVGIWPNAVTVASTSLSYIDGNVSAGTWYIYDVWAVYNEGGVPGTATHPSEKVSILLKTLSPGECSTLSSCPYQSDAGSFKYALSFNKTLYPTNGLSTTTLVAPVPSPMSTGNYRVKLFSAVNYCWCTTISPLLNSRWSVSLKNVAGSEIARTAPSSNFSDYHYWPNYQYKNEVVNDSLSVSGETERIQGEWTGSEVPGTNDQYNKVVAVCAYFEKIDPATGLPYPLSAGSQVSISSFAPTQNPISSGSTATLQWAVSNAVSCSASGGWSGSKNPSGGSETTAPLSNNATFNLTCIDSLGNSDIKTVSVDVQSSNTITAVNCAGVPATANIGETVTWTVEPQPFSELYEYSWSGTDGLSGSAQTITKTYSTVGTKTGLVDISGATNPQQCTGFIRIVATPKFDEF